MIKRTSDIIELIAEKAITFAFFGLCGIAFASLLLYYRGQTEVFVPLAIVLLVISIPVTLYAVVHAFEVRKVKAISIVCPYCSFDNQVTETPTNDLCCRGCNRLIPINEEGKILAVNQVRCGFCNALNYYSEKTDVLLCEECNHEVPIATDDDRPHRQMPSFYAVKDDDMMYELVLLAHGPKTEELITTLQQMLALNRNQVKQLLGELPAVLLTGINRRKAEMLKAQLTMHDGMAEFRTVTEATHT